MAVDANPIDALSSHPRDFAPPPGFAARSNAQPDIHGRADRHFKGSWVQLSEHVAQEIGAITRPKHCRFTTELPKTPFGKTMWRLPRDIADKRPLGDVTTGADAWIAATVRDKAASSDADQLV